MNSLMRRALIFILAAGSAMAGDRTRDVRVARPAATALKPVRQAQENPGATVTVQPLTNPAAFAASPSLSALAPPLATLEATQAVEPEPFVVHGENRVTLKVEHHFTRADARERVTQLLDYWSRRFGVKSEWRGYRVFLTGRVLGIDIKALFDVTDHDVLALASDPGTVLRGSAERYVDKKLHKYLSPTYDEP